MLINKVITLTIYIDLFTVNTAAVNLFNVIYVAPMT